MADERFDFPGDPEFQKRAYWVERNGLQVTSQVEDDPIQTFDCESLAQARGVFADESCDPEVGAPMPGDLIRIVYGQAEGEEFIVESIVAVDDQYGVTGNRSHRPLQLNFGQYRILSRPAA